MSRCTAPGISAARRFDGLIGQSYRTNEDNLFPEHRACTIRCRTSSRAPRLAPTSWLNLTYRTRLDHKTFATRIVGRARHRSACRNSPSARGYIYTTVQSHTRCSTSHCRRRRDRLLRAAQRGDRSAPRSNWGKYRFSGWARRDLQTSQMVAVGADAVYEDECFILDLRFFRRYTSFNGDNGVDDCADPDDVQDDRPVRLQGALTLRRSEVHGPHEHAHACAIALLLAQPCGVSAAVDTAATPAATGDADRGRGEWRRDQQCRCGQPRPAVRAVHRPADDTRTCWTGSSSRSPASSSMSGCACRRCSAGRSWSPTSRSPMRSTRSRRATACRRARCGRSWRRTASASAR